MMIFGYVLAKALISLFLMERVVISLPLPLFYFMLTIILAYRALH